MSHPLSSRRSVLKQLGLAGAGLSIADIRGWMPAALAQGEVAVPFTDIPPTYNPVTSRTNRTLDIRTIEGAFTPKDQFFTTQHYGHPDIDPVSFRLRITGLVNKPLSLSLGDLQKLPAVNLVAGFECSGNSPRSVQGLSSNGRWTGVPLSAVLRGAGVKSQAREFVFFGADHGSEEVEWRGQKITVEQHFGRSLTHEHALSSVPHLVWSLNGEPLTVHQGAPLRLLVPGWYGVANVKWLSHIHVQKEAYLGRFQARWYRTLRGESIDGELVWKESAVTQMRLKSVVARLTTDGSRIKAVGFALNDGTPIKTVEVKVDDGPWETATLDPTTSKEKYSWKLFTYTWRGSAAGPHTIVSRAIDVSGAVQPTAAELETKKTFLEDNAQFVRKFTIV